MDLIRNLALRKQKHHLDFDNDAAMHLQAIELCISDLFRAFEFVEPHDNNAKVFSHRFYELLLRGCTEFESTAKTILNKLGETLRGRANIHSYRKLMTLLPIEKAGVSIQAWNPNPLVLWPFENWNEKKGPDWYRAYNAAKHSRRVSFEEANLINATSAIFAVITLLSVAYGERIFAEDSLIAWSGEGMNYTACADRRFALCRKMPINLYTDGFD